MAEYIERNSAVALLRERGLEAVEKIGSVFANGIFDAVRFLDSFPAADVAPVRHGRWIYDGGDEYVDHYHCGECSAEINLCTEIYTEPTPNYCRNCGAYMREEAHDD